MCLPRTRCVHNLGILVLIPCAHAVFVSNTTGPDKASAKFAMIYEDAHHTMVRDFQDLDAEMESPAERERKKSKLPCPTKPRSRLAIVCCANVLCMYRVSVQRGTSFRQ